MPLLQSNIPNEIHLTAKEIPDLNSLWTCHSVVEVENDRVQSYAHVIDYKCQDQIVFQEQEGGVGIDVSLQLIQKLERTFQNRSNWSSMAG